MSKTYTVTNLRTGRSSDDVSQKGMAALLVEVAGGGYSMIQTHEAMRLQDQLHIHGELKVSTLEISENKS